MTGIWRLGSKMSGIVKVVVDKDRKHRADRIKMKCRNHDFKVNEITDCIFIIDGYSLTIFSK